MKDILCISYSCPPTLEPQSILLAKLLGPLRDSGFRSRVLGLEPPPGTGGSDPSLTKLIPGDTEITRIRASDRRTWFRAVNRYLPSLLRLPDQHLPVYFRASRAGREIHQRSPADLVWSWAQYHSSSLVARALKRRFGIPWVAHFSDPWSKDPFRIGGPVARSINARLEQSVIAEADAVVFVSEETRELTMSRYPEEWRSKCEVIPHCFDPDLYPAERTPHRGLIFRHLGDLYGPRTPIALIRAVAALRESEPGLLYETRFELVGGTTDAIKREIKSLSLEGHVQIRSRVGYLESLREMKDADVLILIEAPAETNVFLPSKLIDYLGAARPVLALTPASGPARRILSGPPHQVVVSGDTAGAAAAIRSYVEAWRSGGLDGLDRASETVRRFGCRATAESLAALFGRVIRQRDSAAIHA